MDWVCADMKSPNMHSVSRKFAMMQHPCILLRIFFLFCSHSLSNFCKMPLVKLSTHTSFRISKEFLVLYVVLLHISIIALPYPANSCNK